METNSEQSRNIREEELVRLRSITCGTGGRELSIPMSFGIEYGAKNYGEIFRSICGGNADIIVDSSPEVAKIIGTDSEGTKVTIIVEKGENYIDPLSEKVTSLLFEMHPEVARNQVESFVSEVAKENNGEGLYGVTLGALENRMLESLPKTE